MRFGLISLGAESSRRISKEAKSYFRIVKQIKLKDLEVHTTQKEIEVMHKGQPLEDFDCLYLRGSYKYALLQRAITAARIPSTYMPLQSESFTIGHDKFITALELKKAKVNIPTTYLAATTKAAKKLLENVNYPIIMKIPSGTQGKGVMFADSISSAKSILDTLEVFKQPYIIQEYIETNATDIRALVIGNKVVAAMRRKAVGDELRANIHLGAIGTACELDYDTEQLALRSAEAVKAEICAVDILEGTKPVVIEVNLSPGLKGLTKATKKNLPKIVAKYLSNKTEEFLKKQKGKDVTDMIKRVETEAKNGKIKEMLSNLNIKAGMIKLPSVITEITGFKDDEEVIFIAEKGKLEIKKHDLKE